MYSGPFSVLNFADYCRSVPIADLLLGKRAVLFSALEYSRVTTQLASLTLYMTRG